MEYNKYKSKCPERLAFSSTRYDPYARQQTQSCTRNSVYCHTSSRKACVPLSPIDPGLPTPPSCMYYKTSTPKDVILPAVTFTSSLADSLLEEETLCRDNLVSSSPSYDLESLATLSEYYYDAFMPSSTVPYDLENISVVTDDLDIFSNITEEFVSYLAVLTPPSSSEIHPFQDEIPVRSSTDHSIVSSNLRPHTTTTEQTSQDEIVSIRNILKSDTTKKSKTDPTAQLSDSRLKCDYCPKKFHFKTPLKVHMRTHTGEKPYTCKVCSRSFTDNSTYVKHVRIHTKEKPYSCDVCNKSFSQSGNLTRHIKIHKS